MDHVGRSFGGLVDRVSQSRVAAVVGLAIAWLLLFPLGPKTAGARVDPSWQAALHMGAHDGLEHGTQIIYTHGPLGYLASPVYLYTPNWQFSTVFGFGSTLALVLVVYWLFSAVEPQGTSGLLTAVVLLGALVFSGLSPADSWLLTASLAALGIVVQGIRLPTRVVVGFGAITALLALVSLATAATVGVALAGAACVSAYVHEGVRRAGRCALVYLGSASVVLVALWVTLGQPLANLDDWASYSVRIMNGYAAAMGTSRGILGLVEMGAAAGLVCALLVVVWKTDGDAAKKTRLGAMALLVVLAYLQFRQSFVRHDRGHVTAIFEFAALTPLAFLPWIRTRAAATLVVLALIPLAAYQAERVSAGRATPVAGPRVESLVDTAVAFVSAERREELEREGRSNILADAEFPSELETELGLDSVHVSPYEASLPYALPGTSWHPAPVFQDFVAYTPELDALNADHLSGPAGPEVVLRRAGTSVDRRMPRWEPPSAMLALVCNYRTTTSEDEWVVLRRETRSRCGDIEMVGEERVGFGEDFSPPDEGPDGMLVARFSGVADGRLDRLRTMVFKAPEVYVETADRTTWRFVQGTQTSWHIMSAPSCVREVLDGDEGPDLSSLRFEQKAEPKDVLDRPLTTGSITVEYGYVPFRC